MGNREVRIGMFPLSGRQTVSFPPRRPHLCLPVFRPCINAQPRPLRLPQRHHVFVGQMSGPQLLSSSREQNKYRNENGGHWQFHTLLLCNSITGSRAGLYSRGENNYEDPTWGWSSLCSEDDCSLLLDSGSHLFRAIDGELWHGVANNYSSECYPAGASVASCRWTLFCY